MVRRRNAAQLEDRRRRGVALLEAGWKGERVARWLRVTPAAVSQWKRAVAQGGKRALDAVPHRGARAKLGAEPVQLIRILRSPTALRVAFSGNLSTISRVQRFVRLQFGVSYSRSGIWRLLQRSGSTLAPSGPSPPPTPGVGLVVRSVALRPPAFWWSDVRSLRGRRPDVAGPASK